jgi:hypothetical protein
MHLISEGFSRQPHREAAASQPPGLRSVGPMPFDQRLKLFPQRLVGSRASSRAGLPTRRYLDQDLE